MFGLAFAVAAAVAFSINAPLAYAATRRGASPTALVAVRNVVAAAVLAPFADFKISQGALLAVVLSSIFGPGLGDYFYFKAMKNSGVATAVTIGYTYIFTAQLFSAAIEGERIKAGALLGSALAFAGVATALGGRPTGRGVLYGVATSLSWGIASALLGAAAREATPYTIAAVRAAVLIPPFLALARGIGRPGLVYAALSGVVGLAAGTLTFVNAMAQIGVAPTVITTSLTPLLSQVFDRAINKSPISPKYIMGALLVSLGIASAVMIN